MLDKLRSQTSYACIYLGFVHCDVESKAIVGRTQISLIKYPFRTLTCEEFLVGSGGKQIR